MISIGKATWSSRRGRRRTAARHDRTFPTGWRASEDDRPLQAVSERRLLGAVSMRARRMRLTFDPPAARARIAWAGLRAHPRRCRALWMPRKGR